ncbi:hypothetical protein [Streptomyces purpurascens]|uniref:hypothetical protein n=1 Tax=Streptomyces purpurascens TaxID=1924 RepID=UPI0016726EB4|nr:hypothetical protein [Streptomyces purpurascens]MCE7049533.1 hypothetical protein [Streptomyces purpurascens]GHA22381.1 hypothetical protein GCM10010303_36120 [Streptomyces purpurascens]
MSTNSDDYRAISREYPDGRRIITVVKNTNEPGQKSDEEILDRIEAEFDRDRRNGYPDSE